MILGFIVLGAAAERLGRFNIRPQAVAAAGMFVFILIQVGLIIELTSLARPLWMLFGFFGTAGIINYADLSQRFPAHMSGRVNTALNLLVFLAAFAAQWGIGAIIDQWPHSITGGYAPPAYRLALILVAALQLAAFLWYIGGRFFKLTFFIQASNHMENEDQKI
jgi:hypothetical protein